MNAKKPCCLYCTNPADRQQGFGIVAACKSRETNQITSYGFSPARSGRTKT
ncbi:MAG: hypothetical protein ACLTWR_07955 [Agathobaculum desmolans]